MILLNNTAAKITQLFITKEAKMSDKLILEGVNKKGYGNIPKLVMKDEQLTIEAKAIYAYFCSYAGGGTSEVFPSIDLICKDLGISENRLFKHRKMLVERGYISIKREKKEKGWSKNIYTIHQTIHLQNVGIQNKGIGNKGIQNEVTNKNSSINNSINNNNKPSSAKLTEDFEKLWELYPKKQGSKKKAFASYKKAIKSGTTNKEIQDGIVAYKKYLHREQWQKPANGDTWFNNERWNNEYEIKEEKNKVDEDWEEKLKKDGVVLEP